MRSAIESEMALCALALRDPRHFDETPLASEQFGELKTRAIWAKVGELRHEGRDFDEVVLLDEMAGHPATDLIPKLAMMSASPALLESYVTRVIDAHLARQVVNVVSSISAQVADSETSGEELVGAALRLFSGIDSSPNSRGLYVNEILKERFRQLHEIQSARDRGESAYTGLPSGLPELDDLLGGFQRGIATVVAARPAMGKSSFVMGVADHLSALGIGTHVFSLEDTRDAYADRVLSRASQVPSTKIRSLDLTREEFSQLKDAANRHKGNRRWFIDDGAGLTADALVRQVRRKRRELNTQLVVVDYLTLLAWPKGASSRYEAVTQNIDVLANAAKQDGMAYVVLSQLSRRVEQRENKRPLMSDLRESGAIEERAKAILFLYREHVYNPNAPEDEVEIIVAKNSNGEPGTIHAHWNGPTTTISPRDSQGHRSAYR